MHIKLFLRLAQTLLSFIFLANSMAFADEEAKRIIEKAIGARGGKESIAKRLCCRMQFKQAFYDEDEKVDVLTDYWSDFPGKAKAVNTSKPNNLTTIGVLNGKQAWTRSLARNVTRDWTEEELSEVEENTYLTKVSLFFPLVEEQGFALSALGEQIINKKKVVGVKVASENHPPVLLYFDRDTCLLVKVVKKVRSDTFEEYHHDYKKYHGFIIARKSTMYKDGKKIREFELLDFEPLKSIDPKMFDKP